MPDDGYRDRRLRVTEIDDAPYPNEPLNVNVQWAFQQDLTAVDIRWSDPALLTTNSNWTILGTNLYRSDNSEFGPWRRLNDVPMSAGFYRDQTINQKVDLEDVTQQFLAKGREDEQRRWIFRTANYPIVKAGTNNVVANSPEDVEVYIDGQRVLPARVYGQTGEIELQTVTYYDVAVNRPLPPVLPRSDSLVSCTYSYNLNVVSSANYQRFFYKVTTVAIDAFTGQTIETPLHVPEARHIHQMENLDYIWREAVRRNKWILYQGGLRVFLFIRKTVGVPCDCVSDLGHARQDCQRCFGTMIRGGYEGPYEILIAPPDARRQIIQTPDGLHTEKVFEAWTGPTPLISQRDFIVMLNGDRYALGGTQMPTNRGNVLQQHFEVSLLDQGDIRYKVPVTGTQQLAYPQTRIRDFINDPDERKYPQITEKCNIPDEREERGRTPSWENIQH